MMKSVCGSIYAKCIAEVVIMLYAGIDTHKKYSRVVVTDSSGQIVAQKLLSNDIATFKDFFIKRSVPDDEGGRFPAHRKRKIKKRARNGIKQESSSTPSLLLTLFPKSTINQGDELETLSPGLLFAASERSGRRPIYPVDRPILPDDNP
jgi:hypothetical protein